MMALTLAAHYQLAQSVLKIGFVLVKKGRIGGGWVGGPTLDMLHIWQLS